MQRVDIDRYDDAVGGMLIGMLADGGGGMAGLAGIRQLDQHLPAMAAADFSQRRRGWTQNAAAGSAAAERAIEIFAQAMRIVGHFAFGIAAEPHIDQAAERRIAEILTMGDL